MCVSYFAFQSLDHTPGWTHTGLQAHTWTADTHTHTHYTCYLCMQKTWWCPPDSKEKSLFVCRAWLDKKKKLKIQKGLRDSLTRSRPQMRSTVHTCCACNSRHDRWQHSLHAEPCSHADNGKHELAFKAPVDLRRLPFPISALHMSTW